MSSNKRVLAVSQKSRQGEKVPLKRQFWIGGASLFLLSFSVLTYEITLTRIFSILFSYHYAFTVLAFVLFGMGVGGMALKRWKSWYPHSDYSYNASLYAVLILGAVIGMTGISDLFGTIPFTIKFWIFIPMAVLPFIMAGLTIADLFQRFAAKSSWLYGFDLSGAALGALAAVPQLNLLGGPQTAMMAVSVAALGAIMMSISIGKRVWIGLSVFVIASTTLALSITGIIRLTVPVSRDPDKEMYAMLTNPEEKAEIVESRWSAFGRTDLVRSSLNPNQMYLFIDGAAGTPMYNLDALLNDPQERFHLIGHFGEYFPFWIIEEEQKDSALIIGPGGGRDVVIALLGGVKSITAVEVNPEMIELVKEYEEFNGGIYTSIPNVKVVSEEGRKFLRSSDSSYDLIMMALPITKSSRSLQGYALTENYLFTVEAIADYLDHLTPEGRLIVVTHGDAEVYRLIVLALEAFRREGLSESEAMKHIYTLASGIMPTVVIQKRAFTLDEADERHVKIHQMGFDRGNFFVPYVRDVQLRPDEKLSADSHWRLFDQVLVDISNGKLSLDRLIKVATMDIGPVFDDRPFFYKFVRGLPSPFPLFLAINVIAIAGLLRVLLSRRRWRARNSLLRSFSSKPELKRFLLIFFLLGQAFMLIEIALFQKLMLHIGQPVLALSVLLFSLLLGVGIGSLLSSRVKKHRDSYVAAASLAISLLTILYAIFSHRAFSFDSSPVLIATSLLIPLGIVLGFPFPLSIRLMKDANLQDKIHLMWGINGITSVLGSSLAMIVGILFGFTYALIIGALLYIIVGVTAFFFFKPTDDGSKHIA